MPTLEQIAERKASIDAACAKAGHDPIPFTVMTTCVIGADQPDFARRLAAFRELTGSDPDATTAVIGTLKEAKERLAELEGAGVSGIYLQHLLHRDVDMVELIGQL
jgi:alkanesulfonate monooxygenase SsuD/methylene tetrahydromethanopterin reductase-like flavin-dependent oxidoreductase (luciferase family)